MLVDRVLRALRAYRFTFRDESELQEAVAQVLAAEGLAFTAEEDLGDAGRIDFWCAEEGVGIEVKISGSVNEVNRQLQRYAMHEDCKALVLATTRLQHLRGIPTDLQGVPVYIARLRDAL